MKSTLAKTGLLAVVILGSSIFLTQSAFADTTSTATTTQKTDTKRMKDGMGMGMDGMDKNHDAIMTFLGIYQGRVTAVSGTTLTIQSKANTTMTVNAASAVVMRDGKDSTVSAIVVDDMIMIRGDLSGTTITATKIAAMPKPTKKAMNTMKKMMKDGIKDIKQGMKDKKVKLDTSTTTSTTTN